MSIVELHSVPKDTVLSSSRTFLTVVDDSGALVADYSLCTGLRLLQDEDNWIVYINEADLVPGTWTLFLDTTDEAESPQRVTGVKEGDPVPRLLPEFPWSNCGTVPRVSNNERSSRLAVCQSCPLFEQDTMACGQSGKFVLDVTTRDDEFCPQELWGDKEAVLQARVDKAIADGNVPEPDTSTGSISAEDQQAFEAELAAFLEGTA